MTKKLHASEQQKKASRSNIKAKLRVLNKWAKEELPWKTDDAGNLLRDGNGDKIVEWFPQNGRQFCQWDGSQCSPGTKKALPELRSISRTTLYKDYNEDLKHEAESLFEVLVALEEKLKSSSSNASEIERLKKDLSYWQSVAKAEANAVLEMLKKVNEVEKKYRRGERVRKNNEEKLQEQIRQLKAENGALNKVVAKVAPMRGVD
ncbi:MAG: hypothetical protein JAZ17_11350 [Candidatus Thiodiazotropha endolucinida]|nr:hypothetical protein [Candidatus Thiodiazotropha taylori]MCG8094203.1 hypothetical protein [Candidatus Thiodiazotropha endolucinida]MCG8047669.1 hypothetical protein [Candidatus Thiodiazotropha taylori]MCG8053733.1 hypothetical protein [Candidatus Thiodiazotropha taylori]MCW4315553.1 hypothetical protein [Candidatus Thiodiazotropha taylori]